MWYMKEHSIDPSTASVKCPFKAWDISRQVLTESPVKRELGEESHQARSRSLIFTSTCPKNTFPICSFFFSLKTECVLVAVSEVKEKSVNGKVELSSYWL